MFFRVDIHPFACPQNVYKMSQCKAVHVIRPSHKWIAVSGNTVDQLNGSLV